MKIITVFFGLLICTLSLKSQECKPFSWTAAFEAGYSINRTGVAGFNFGANFSQFTIRVGLDAHLNGKVRDGLVIRSQIGHTFDFDNWYATASIGHAYLYKSADVKGMNSNEFLINPEIGYKIELKEQPLAIYLSGTKAGEFKIVAVGIRGYF